MASAGFSVSELLVVLTMSSIIGSFAVSRLGPTLRPTYDLSTASKQLVANLRMARTKAISRNVHYRVRVTSISTYEVQRLTFDQAANSWIDGRTEVVSLRLPTGVEFITPAPDPVGAGAEFDARGIVAQPATTLTLTLRETVSGTTCAVQAFPSGQISATAAC